MKKVNINQTGKGGWFIGCFPEAAVQTDLAEVCYTIEPPGPIQAHYHTKCTETIFIIRGQASCQNQRFEQGDMFVIPPGEINNTIYLTECEIISVKVPAGGNDKVLVERHTD